MCNLYRKWRTASGFSMDWDSVQIDVEQLAPKIFYLRGSGSNTLALVGAGGTLLVDPQFAPMAPKIKAALNGLGAEPVRYVVNTHFHPDHSGGNAFFRREGATIVSHANGRARLLERQHSYFWGRSQAPIFFDDAPSLTFERELDLHLNDEHVHIFQVQAAHTDADAIVFFKKANVVHMGDVFLRQLYPYIDLYAKGHIDGYFPVIDSVLAMIDDDTRVVPGHGPITDKATLKAFRDMLATTRERVARRIEQDQSLEDIIASQPTQEWDEECASDRVGPEGFVAMVYQSLTGTRLDWQPETAAPPGPAANLATA